MNIMGRPFSIVSLLLILTSFSGASQFQNRTKLGVLDFGPSPVGKMVAETLRSTLGSAHDFELLDPDLSASAARGVGYSGSLNLSLAEARDLGAAMGAEFYLVGDAQTLRRSSTQTPVYYESYSSIFVISSRTGRLVFWDRINTESDNPRDAERKLTKLLSDNKQGEHCLAAIRKAQVDESGQRMVDLKSTPVLIEEAPDDETRAAAEGLRLPRPFRRLRPVYTESAARAEVEATVDVLVDISADGEVGQVQVARWAGFGLDETTVATVRQLHFFPAMRNGTPIPIRVLLRYNFRKPAL
jgi:TonB family protein